MTAIAQLALVSANSLADEALAAVHLATALVLREHGDAATHLIDELDRTGLELAPLIQAVTDAIAHHAEHAPALAALIARITGDA